MGKGSKGKGKKDDLEFDQLLKELEKKTSESHSDSKQSKRVSNHERRENFHKRQQEQDQQKQDEVAAAMEKQQRAIQIRQLIQQMMAQQRPYLEEPNTEFSFEEESSSKYEACAGWMQGWRVSQEDAHIVNPSFDATDNTGLFCVFDGHGGSKCANLCHAVLPIMAQQNFRDGKVDFTKAYLSLDAALRTKLQDQSGCTAVSLLVSDKEITCASVGDSRAVLCRKGGVAVSLSDDHKPENPTERARIEAGGGHVADNRVNGNLAMSRALGDFQYKDKDVDHDKHLVMAIPDEITVKREDGDEFAVVACDGIFDVLTNEELIAFIRSEFAANKDVKLPDLCKKVCMHCLAPGMNGSPIRGAGTDNMTLIIIKFK